MVEWYFDYLTHRNLYLTLHGITVGISVSTGFPQGGVASAKFWIIAFNMALKIINSFGINGTAFADDCAALVNGVRLKSMVLKMQKMLDSLVKWGKKCGLIFNSQKTVVVFFSRRRKTLPICLRIGGRDINYSANVKYLGVTLDSKLTWQLHIRNKIVNAKKLLMLALKAVRSNWGPNSKLSKWAYTGIVRPMISYASMCWSHEIYSAKIQKELLKIDRLALLAISQVAPSSPTRGLAVIYDLMPLHLFLEPPAIMSFFRLARLLPLGWNSQNKASFDQP